MELYDVRKFVRAFFPIPLQKFLLTCVRKTRGYYGLAKYKGKGTYCPCCQKSFKRFRNYPFVESGHDVKWNGNPENILCPFCMSLAHHRIICDVFSREKWLVPPMKILHFAPEQSILEWMRIHGIPVITADYYDKLVDFKIDIQNIELQDDSMDFIICNQVLEHVPDFHRSLDELYRVLKKEGILILSVPIWSKLSETYEDPSIVSPEERAAHFGQEDHYRIFGTNFESILKEHNFAVTVADGEQCDPCIRAVSDLMLYSDYGKIFVCKKTQ